MSHMDQQSSTRPPIPSPRPDVPLEVQFPPPPRPPSQQQQAPLAASGALQQDHTAGFEHQIPEQLQTASYQASQLQSNAFEGADEKQVVVNSPVQTPQAPNFPPAPGQQQQLQQNQYPEHGQYPTPSPLSPQPREPAQHVTQPPPMVQTAGSSSNHSREAALTPQNAQQTPKQQEHELHQEPSHHDAPPAYTLEDEGPYAGLAQTEEVRPDGQEKGSLGRPVERDEGLYAPPLPPRHQQDPASLEIPPPMPPRPQHPAYSPEGPPPSRQPSTFMDDDPSNPVHYTRDPHRLIGYLVPFPKPKITGIDPSKIPTRFLIYTPPPPPLQAPPEGVEESRMNKIQRKWQNEVRSAKQSDAKLASWKGVKSRATKGISWAMGAVKSAELDFLNRVPAAPSGGPNRASSRSPRVSTEGQSPDLHANDGREGNDHKTVGLEALDLIYPPSLTTEISDGEQGLRAEFINSMMRTRSKAQKDAVIATGLLPVTAAIDILATVIWPFGGLLEVDSVWAYASIRGAKTARSVTKRLASSTHPDTTMPDNRQDTKETLALHFLPSSRLEVLRRYLANKCVDRDPRMFAGARDVVTPATESTVLSAIGWESSQSGGETRNWEDEEWETQEVKEDLKMVFGKAAKSWEKWCKGFEKNPDKALKR